MIDKYEILGELGGVANHLFETSQNNDMRQYIEKLMDKINAGYFDVKEKECA